MAAPIAAALICASSALAAACTDLCVLSGAPCDSSSDCSGGRVCRLRRGFELGCLFARGSCVEGGCGSVDECPVEHCCDPESNRCVAQSSYAGACDGRTCRSCGTACDSDDECAAEQKCSYDRCRLICSYDSDCPGAICNGTTCSAPMGAACDGSQDCAGLSCTTLTPGGGDRAGYCTGHCSESEPCPEGYYFACVDDQCRMP